MMQTSVSIIIVSYNTRQLTLECLSSVYKETRTDSFEVIVVDNASTDGSAEAIEEAFPDVRLIANDDNTGFAAANNLGAKKATGQNLLLLNSDTVVLDGAIDNLIRFADEHPNNGVYGGRTLYADGSLNPTSCWADITPWSMFCRGVGLSSLFRHTRLFDPESYGRWRRDSVREVQIVTGCLLLIKKRLWEQLGGFDESYFMYGEDADLCSRARAIGARPLICPIATIVHHGGRSDVIRADKVSKLLASRSVLIRRSFTRRWVSFGLLMQRLWVLRRYLGWKMLSWAGIVDAQDKSQVFCDVWRRRRHWDH